MSCSYKVLAAILGLGVATAGHAAITPLDSASFTKKFEMTATGPNELDPLGTTNEWAASVSTGGGATASLSGGFLNYDSSVFANRDALWESVTDTSVYNNASGSTVEVSLRVLSGADGGASLGNELRAFDIFLGDDSDRGNLQIHTDHVSFAGAGTIHTGDNTDAYHVFRVAQDSDSNVYHVWRDGVLISGLGLTGGGAAHNLFVGDGSGDFSGEASVDYVRWSAGGFSPIPEPATLGVLAAVGTLLMARRRL